MSEEGKLAVDEDLRPAAAPAPSEPVPQAMQPILALVAEEPSLEERPKKRRRPGRKPDLLTASDRQSAALRALEMRFGGRQKLVRSLQVLPLEDDERLVMELFADPRNDRKGLAMIAKMAGTGMTVSRLLKLIGKAVGAEALLAAHREIYEPLPLVARDIMQRSVPAEEACWPCRGGGKVPLKPVEGKEQEDCGICRGTGKITLYPDLDRQKVALELGGLLKPRGGVQVTQISDNRSVGLIGLGARLREETDALLKGGGGGRGGDAAGPAEGSADVVDGEVVGPDEPSD